MTETGATDGEATDPSPPSEPAKRRPAWLWGVGACILVLVIGGGVIFALTSGGSSSSKHTLTGSIRLTDSGISQLDGCSGTGGYSDMQGGTAVVVKDGAGKIIGTGSLAQGTVPLAEKYHNVKCDFAFTVADLPRAAFYSVEVSHRGAQSYSFTDLEGQGWHLSLTLGT